MNLRVLMFGWEFPPHNSGGLGTACYGLTKALSALPVKVFFVLPKRVPVGAPFVDFLFADIEKFSVHQVDTLLYPYVTLESYNQAARAAASPIYGRSLLEEVRLYGERAAAVVRGLNFDIIHAHDWLAFPAGLLAKKISGKPLVVHTHATEFDRTGGQGVNTSVYEIERQGFLGADRIVTVSQLTKDIVVKHYGINPEKITVVHNGIEVDDYRGRANLLGSLKAAGYKIVAFIGRITIQKGPDYFIKVAKKVLEHNPKVYFVVAGSGDMERQIINEAVNSGIADRVMFAGFVRGQELNDLYASIDLYILPSVSEPFGLTPLEALANGTPVLVSKQSGVAEVLRHALKVDFWDIDEMANQILAVLTHPPLARTLLQHGREEAKRITWRAAAEKCLNIYRQILGQPA